MQKMRGAGAVVLLINEVEGMEELAQWLMR